MSGYLLGASTGAVALVVWLVVIPLGLREVFDALGVSRSRAWVPFVNLATVYRLGGLSEYWLIVLVVPPAGLLGIVMLFIASHRITRRLGHSGWLTVLAVIQWWVWVVVIGLLRARRRSSTPEPVVWSVRRPDTPLRLPPADDATPSASSPLFQPAAFPGVASQPSAPRPTAPQPSAFESAAFQPTAQVPRLDVPVEAPAPQVSVPAPQASVPAPHTSVPAPQVEPDDDATILTHGSADHTVISPRRQRWAVHTTTGSRIELVGTSAILGRRPRPHPLYPGAQLIMVTDDTTSVSATHAALEFVDGEWQVTDLGSTNGVWLVDPASGEERELGAHQRRPVTPTFMLGELGVQVKRNV